MGWKLVGGVCARKNHQAGCKHHKCDLSPKSATTSTLQNTVPPLLTDHLGIQSRWSDDDTVRPLLTDHPETQDRAVCPTGASAINMDLWCHITSGCQILSCRGFCSSVKKIDWQTLLCPCECQGSIHKYSVFIQNSVNLFKNPLTCIKWINKTSESLIPLCN